MGISRDSRHKRRLTGGRRNIHQKKRKYEIGRPPANTRIGSKNVHLVRGRGGNIKHRALRLDTGNFSWGTETVSRKARILDVVYNSTNNELVRTKTLVRSAIVQIDATPFRTYYEQKYGVALGKKKIVEAGATETKVSEKTAAKRAKALAANPLDQSLREQFSTGRLYAIISSRPGQSGRCDGVVLEGHELDFYMRKLTKKK